IPIEQMWARSNVEGVYCHILVRRTILPDMFAYKTSLWIVPAPAGHDFNPAKLMSFQRRLITNRKRELNKCLASTRSAQRIGLAQDETASRKRFGYPMGPERQLCPDPGQDST